MIMACVSACSILREAALSLPARSRGGLRSGGWMVSRLRLSLACWNYDRTRALMDESIKPDGIDLTYLNLPVEETFFRMLRHGEFDVAEMSLSSYTVSMFRGRLSRSRFSHRGCFAIRRSTSMPAVQSTSRKT
jgi:hypothetical protein